MDRVQGGNAPDLAIVPQPGLLRTLIATGKVKEAPAETTKNVDANWSAQWKTWGSVDGKFYAAPLGANMKSYVWYSPKAFSDKGYKVPESYAELMTLTAKIAADNPDGKKRPWCAGFGSGDASGWPGTDWIEDVLLRTASPEVYDKWVTHQIAFNDPQVVAALGKVGEILKNPKYTNGGLGEPKSIATTAFGDGGTPILDGNCYMHKQADFYATFWGEGTKVAADGDVWAFYFPAVDPTKAKPVLGGGEFIAAFSDRPEVKAFQTYLSSGEWANNRAKADSPAGGFVSANNKLDLANVKGELGKQSVRSIQDAKENFRFDGSDLMPASVGAGTFWKSIQAWIVGDKDDATMLKDVEASWPKS